MGREFELVQRLDFIKSISAGKKVLHLGCTNWPYTNDALAQGMLLHSELSDSAAELYGFDFDREGIAVLEEKGFTNLFQADLEKLEEVPLDETFEVIIAGEMIEHLNNPGLFLNGIKRFMGPQTKLVITTINAYGGMRFLIYGLRGNGGKAEPVHPDHIAYFSYSTLNLLLDRHRFNIEKFMFYDLGTEHRPGNGWLRNTINDVCVAIAPQWADGIIAVCMLPDESK